MAGKLQEKQINIEKMKLDIVHRFPHYDGSEEAAARREAEGQLFLILQKYDREEYKDV